MGDSGGVLGADIKATKAWDLSVGNANVVVGIVDSGVQTSHPDLAANLMTPVTKLLDGDTPEDRVGHGTHVAGTIGAIGNNQIGVAGVNWSVSMAPCKFIGPDGSGPTSAAVACLDYLAQLKDSGLNLVATNNSWGGLGYSQALYDIIQAHMQRGILFIVAAGNGDPYGHGLSNDELPQYPASFDLDNIISVAATDRSDQLATFFTPCSNHQTDLRGGPGASINQRVIYHNRNVAPVSDASITNMLTRRRIVGLCLMWCYRYRNWTSERNFALCARSLLGDFMNPNYVEQPHKSLIQTIVSTITGDKLTRTQKFKRDLITLALLGLIALIAFLYLRR